MDDALRLLPYLDYANHDDDYDSLELKGGTLGMMLWGGSAKGVLLKSGKSSIAVGDEIRISYGPKGPADYLLDHGFVPPMCRVGGGGGGGPHGPCPCSQPLLQSSSSSVLLLPDLPLPLPDLPLAIDFLAGEEFHAVE